MEFLGYDFKDEGLLREALTTPSYRMSHPQAADNQRLEFLGDAVLGLLSAEDLYAKYAGEDEGALTVRRQHMVSTAALCAVANRYRLGDHLLRGVNLPELPPHSKILADAFEAVVGAAYLDGGLEAARQIFLAMELTERADEGEWSDNPKGELQVRAQAMVPPRHPVYALVKREGPAHRPLFTVCVTIEGVGSATASAGTRKEADALAAAQLLKNLV